MLTLTDLPRNEAEFHRRFGTEEACRVHLASVRWPRGFVCPRCENGRGYELKGRDKWECSGCGYHCSLRAGTVMAGSKKPLTMWFAAMYYMVESKQGFSALGLMRRLGLGSYQTAWTWFQKLREMLPKDEAPLEGKVEADLIYLGGVAARSGFRGRSSPKRIAVILAVECRGRGSGRVRARILRDNGGAGISRFFRENLAQGTVVKTDAETAFSKLTAMGYVHDSEICEDDETLSRHLPRVFRVQGLIKRVMNGTHMGAVAPWRLQRYLDEYAFRFERKSSPTRYVLFQDLLASVVGAPCRTYAKIVADMKEGVAGHSIMANRARGRRPARPRNDWWLRLLPDVPWPAPPMAVGEGFDDGFEGESEGGAARG